MEKKGMSKTAFVIISIIIGFGILSTTVLAFFTGKPLGTMTIGYLIFGILTGVMFGVLSEVDFKLDDDLKITFNKTIKHVYSEKKFVSKEEGLEDFPPDELINDNDEIELDN